MVGWVYCMHFWLKIFSTDDGFIGTLPRCKSRKTCSWNHTKKPHYIGFFHFEICIYVSCVYLLNSSVFSAELYSILHISNSWFIHLLKDIIVAPNVWWLWINLQWIPVCTQNAFCFFINSVVRSHLIYLLLFSLSLSFQ